MFSSDGKQSRISRIKRDFKIQRRDGNENVKKQQLCTCSTLFCIFLCRFCRLRRENAYIWQGKCVRIIAINTERMQTYVLSDVLVAVASLDLKAPDRRRERDCLNYPLKSWERRRFPRSRSQASGKDKAGFSRGHNYLKHQIHHVFAQVHLLLPSPQPNVGFTGNVFKINIDGRKIKKSAHTTSSPGLFPQRMGGAPHLFFEGKALGTRLLHTFHRMWQRWLIPFSYNSPGDSPCNGQYGRAPPERGSFFRLQVY